MASKRQQNLVSLKVEKERKEAEKGPAWYYETYLVKVRKGERRSKGKGRDKGHLLHWGRQDCCMDTDRDVLSKSEVTVLRIQSRLEPFNFSWIRIHFN